GEGGGGPGGGAGGGAGGGEGEADRRPGAGGGRGGGAAPGEGAVAAGDAGAAEVQPRLDRVVALVVDAHVHGGEPAGVVRAEVERAGRLHGRRIERGLRVPEHGAGDRDAHVGPVHRIAPELHIAPVRPPQPAPP